MCNITALANIIPYQISVFQVLIGGHCTLSLLDTAQFTVVGIVNALKITSDDLLCDSVIKSRIQFERDIALILEDCDEYEIRVIRDIAAAAKEALRRDERLRKL